MSLVITARVQGLRRITTQTGKSLGDLIVGDDGYWTWWPPRTPGAFSEANLLEIAAGLQNLNAEWDKIVQEGLKP